ncbi:MAG: SPOR domain-containing protein [Candidatus Omnitrophica bacterium]|nr:SPOR domain-containing protein [Candidatus Omnitrophota bacterium]
MTENDFKNDFFEGRFYEAGKKKSRLVNRCSERRAVSHIKIPVEYAVILVIVIMTFVTVAYAVGVKNGKASVKNDSVSENIVIAAPAPELKEIVVNVISESSLPDGEAMPESKEIEEVVSGDVVFSVETEKDVSEELIQAEEEIQEEPEIDSELLPQAEYIVCLASFKNKKFAAKDISALTRDGVRTRLAKKGDWYQLYAEGFTTIDEARKAKEKLTKTYKDCYIKRTR